VVYQVFLPRSWDLRALLERVYLARLWEVQELVKIIIPSITSCFFFFIRGDFLIFKCILDAKRPRSDDIAAGQPPMKKTPGLAAPTLPSQARASPDSYRPVSLKTSVNFLNPERN
jgi:hypothetical protein